MNAADQPGLKQAAQRPASMAQTVRAVAWSFFGVRRSADFEQDTQKLNPLHVVVAGVLGAVVFVLGVLFLVRWVLSSGVAA